MTRSVLTRLSTIAVAIAALLTATTATEAAKPERPVVIIPGIVGSKLCKGKEVVWGTVDSLKKFASLALPVGDPGNAGGIKPCGVISRIKVLDLFNVDQYSTLFTLLKNKGGYVEKKTLFTFDYDWRLSNFHNAQKLAAFIDRNIGADKKFDIVAHSMGGLLARLYVQSPAARGRVDRLVLMGVPNRGSARIFEVLKDGWGKSVNADAGGIDKIRATMLSFPAVFELLPSYPDCCATEGAGGKTTGYDATNFSMWRRFDWLPKQFKSPKGAAALFQMLLSADRMHAEMKKKLAFDGSYSMNLFSAEHSTPKKAFMNIANAALSDFSYAKGDGAVLSSVAKSVDIPIFRRSRNKHHVVFADDKGSAAILAALQKKVRAKPAAIAALAIEPDNDFVPKSIRSVSGKRFATDGIRWEIEPKSAKTGTTVDLIVLVAGGPDLAKAASERFDVKLTVAGKSALFAKPELARSARDPAPKLKFSARFRMPATAGSKDVKLTIPGLGSFTDTIVVTP